MGWQQYSRPLWLSIDNHYILYLKAMTERMRGLQTHFPQLDNLTVFSSICRFVLIYLLSVVPPDEGVRGYVSCVCDARRGDVRLIGRARRPSSILFATLWLLGLLWLGLLWLVAAGSASFHRRGPWLHKRLQRSIGARYGERHRMIPPDSRQAYRYVRGRVGRRRREVR